MVGAVAGIWLGALSLATAGEASATRQPVTVTDATGEIRIDGVLDEPDWGRATPVTDFVRFKPTAGGPPPGNTEVRFLQDERALYISMKVTDTGYPIRARISEREDVNADDQLGLYLDTFGDGQSAYVFYVNAMGIQQDARYSVDDWTMDWDAVFTTEGRVTGDGFVIEMALPFRSIRHGGGEGPQTWGVYITRKVPSEGAKYVYPVRERNASRFMRGAAPLQGVKPASSGAGLEILPGLTVQQQAARPDEGGELAWQGLDPWAEAVRPSLDIRYGLTPNVGIAAAVNPDFSQVEADETPIELNRRFAFWFDERRPFFLDGSLYFDDPVETLYSRSIVDPIGGVKVSGKEGPWSVGLLGALDRAPTASVHELGAPGFDAVDEAQAANTLARVSRDVGEGATVGLTVADKRVVPEEGADGVHHSVALDTNVPLGGRWEVELAGAGSRTTDGATELLGTAAGAGLKRRSGVGTGVSLRMHEVSPDFRQELGFLNQSGRTDAFARVDHTFEPDGAMDTVQPELGAWWGQEREGDGVVGAFGGHEMRWSGRHQLGWSGSLSRIQEEGVEVDGWEGFAHYSADLTSWLVLNPWASLSRTIDFGELVPAQAVAAGWGTTLRPTPGIRLDHRTTHQRFMPEGSAPETAWRQRLRLQWQFSQAWGLRLVGEAVHGNSVDTGLISSALLRYLPHPGTALYVGYAESTDLAAGPQTQERTVFAKGTFLLRL